MINKLDYEKNVDLVCKDVSMLTPLMQTMVAELIVAEPMLGIVETWRSGARQNKMYKTGKSKTDNSLHEVGEAIDYFHKKLGYNIPDSWYKSVRDKWKVICIKHGYPKVCFPSFETGHLSINNGNRC